MPMNTHHRFNLRTYVAADVRRYRQCFHKDDRNQDIPKIRLCLSALSPRFAPILLLRLSHAATHHHLGLIGKLLSMMNFVIFGLEVASTARIGPGLLLPHTYGIVIGAREIGLNATIFQGVTLGAVAIDPFYELGRPYVGNNVTIGAGAKILGEIRIGDDVNVGANSVVLKNVGNGLTVGGIPATVLHKQSSTLL